MRSHCVWLAVVTAIGCESAPEVVAGHEEPFHHLRIQNETVRVIDVHIPPGAVTAYHTHPIDAAVVFLTSTEYQIEELDGTVRPSTSKRGTAAFGPSATIHRARCTGTTPFHAIAVELLVTPPGQAGAARDQPIAGGQILLENDQVRIVKIVLRAGQSLDSRSGVKTVLVAMESGSLSRDDEGAAAVNPGDVWWEEDGELRLRNRGVTPFEATAIQILPR